MGRGSKITVGENNPNNAMFQVITPGATQSAAYTGTAAVIANGFATHVTVVRLISTTDCFVKFGSAPTATTSDIFLPANTAEYFGVTPGDKVSAVQASSNGNLYVCEGAAE